jgi:hypothetical protein
MIVCANFKGRLAAGEINNVHFEDDKKTPRQVVIRTQCGTMMIFPSGKFRIMGVRTSEPILDQLPFKNFKCRVTIRYHNC